MKRPKASSLSRGLACHRGWQFHAGPHTLSLPPNSERTGPGDWGRRLARWTRRSATIVVLLGAVLGPLAGSGRAADEQAVIEKRLADSVRYLASDELEGRGLGTKGLELAADYIADQFTQIGLRTELFAKTSRQKFKVTTSAKLGPNNKLALVRPAAEGEDKDVRIELTLGDDYTPMSISGCGRFDLPLVFVGYGITGKAEGYDDYKGIDVAGKAVVILRHEPQQADPQSVFNGAKNSSHAPLRQKLSNAHDHNAAAVVFCTDQFEINKNLARARKQLKEAEDRLKAENVKFENAENPSPEETQNHRRQVEKLNRRVKRCADKVQAARDPVLSFHAGGRGGRNLPVVHCRRGVLDPIFCRVLQKDLAAMEREMDRGPTPDSKALGNWHVVGQVDIQHTEAETENVAAVLEGQGPQADETIVIGAHYDHLGLLGAGSSSPGRQAIHNGADDNASGVSVMIEVARSLASRPQKLNRRVLFLAFTAEERGLLGSSHYVRNPLFPVEKTVAMLNLDMVGRLRDDKLVIAGVGTAKRFDTLLERINRHYGFRLTKKSSGRGPSDHASFYARQVPVMHFFTGIHKDYHRPSDDFEKLNIAGMRRISELVTEIAVELANAGMRPQYVAAAPAAARSGGGRPSFGSIPDFGRSDSGYALSGVIGGGPAERAGLRAGDLVVKFGSDKIGNLDDFDAVLRKHKAGDRVGVVVRRGDQELTFEVTLDPPQ